MSLENKSLFWGTHCIFICLRLECVTITGIVLYSCVLTNAITPHNTDESVAANMARTDQQLGKQGNILRLLVGFPDFFLVHLFDNGFR